MLYTEYDYEWYNSKEVKNARQDARIQEQDAEALLFSHNLVYKLPQHWGAKSSIAKLDLSDIR